MAASFSKLALFLSIIFSVYLRLRFVENDGFERSKDSHLSLLTKFSKTDVSTNTFSHKTCLWNAAKERIAAFE